MPIARVEKSIDDDYVESNAAEQLFNKFAGLDFTQVPSSNSNKAEEKSLQQKRILPDVEIAEAGNWLLQNADKFDIKEGLFKDGDLSLKEIELALKSKTNELTLDERAHLRFYRKNFAYFMNMTAEFNPIGESITKSDMYQFNARVNEYAEELSTLKQYEPGRYEAVSSLRQNFKWLDHNKDGRVSYEEVTTGMNLPNLSEVDKRGLKAVANYFPIITEGYTAGYDRPIKADTITDFILKSNLPYQKVYSGRYGTSQPHTDIWKKERMRDLDKLLETP